MKKWMYLFLLIVLINSALTAEVRLDSSGRPLYASDRIKVKLNETASIRVNDLLNEREKISNTGLESLDTLNRQFGIKSIDLAHRPVMDKAWERETGFNRWYLLFVPEGTDIEQAIDQYSRNEFVEFANPEYIKYLSATPNDTYFSDCWGHDNTSSNGPGSGHTVGFDSHIEEAWDDEQGYGSSSIIVAIIDTGVDYNHEDLDDNCVAGYDYGDNDSDPMDDSGNPSVGHGTSCAGVAAAEVNNAIGVSGVAGNCSIMPLKVCDTAGNLYDSYIIDALTHCGDNNVDVASMSFGSDTEQGDSPSSDAAVAYAYNNGVTLLAATANDDYSHIHNPANDEHVIAIGAASPCAERKDASSCDGQYWWGSNYGVDTQDARDAVDIISPTILPATDITGSAGFSTGDYYMTFNGTSCATPYAAGVAALVLSKNPLLTPTQVRTALTSTATDVIDEGPAGWDRYTGYGMVNADGAVGSVGGSGFPFCDITYPANGQSIEIGTIVTIEVDASDPSRS
ncbi:MAG: S8 family serine peptidase, partial [Candidatus Cloacimonetes bacterium]|nr:S8 family serine peptidase [Candidatus Cloacimonadota bacterium]